MTALAQWNGWDIFDAAGRRKYLNAAERTRFLAAADDLDGSMRALCYALVYLGCRISEALALTLSHLDFDQRTILLRTLKRRCIKFRIVPVPETLLEMLRALAAAPEDRIWHIHRVTAWRTIKRVMFRAGIMGPMACPRGLRHTFGMRAANANVPPTILQKWMGHSSLKTTGIYIDAMSAEERRFAARMW